LEEGKDPASLDRKPKDMSLVQLREETAKMTQEGIETTPLRVELHRRFSMAFSPLIFILIGLPLGITTRRAQRSVGFGLSVIIFIGYYLFLVLGQTLAEKGLMPVAPAMWLGNAVFFIAGSFLLWRTARQ